MLDEDMKQSFRKAIDNAFKEEWFNYQQPDYYPKRRYGKWTIYNKEGMRVAWGMNEREMKAYMKLLKEE
jgi:hypothetical protein